VKIAILFVRNRGSRAGWKNAQPASLASIASLWAGYLTPTLICGGPGCGRTMFALEFLARGAMEFGEAGVFVSFEETAEDLHKNISSLGVDLSALVDKKLMVVDHVRVECSEIEETGEYDLEGLFIRLGHAIDSIGARRVVLDTLEALFSGLGNTAILRAELRRLFQCSHHFDARRPDAAGTRRRPMNRLRSSAMSSTPRSAH
jgi:hypothetical protein